jgi:hypothetical protein
MAVRPIAVACRNLVHFQASMEHFSRQDKRLLSSSGRFDANGIQKSCRSKSQRDQIVSRFEPQTAKTGHRDGI